MAVSKKVLFQNILVLVISIGGASVCGILLYRDLYLEKSSADGHLPAGHLADKHQTVKRKLGDNLVWDLIADQEILYWDDSIQTGEKSGARIVLDSGSEISLGESSLVVLEKDNDQLNLDLKSGQVVVASNNNQSGQSIKINGALVKRNAGQELSVQMDDKNHVVTATATSSDGTAKQTTVDDKGHVEEKVISVILNSPASLSHLSSEESLPRVAFKWQSNAPMKTLQISSDLDFQNIVLEKKLIENQFDAQLPPGSYFWRVKLENQFSEARSFDLVREVAPRLDSMAGPQHVIFTTEVPLMEFKWGADSGASKYILEISDSATFENPIVRLETSDNSLQTSDLKPGHFFWRVSSVFGDAVKSSASKRFELEQAAPPESPVTTGPAETGDVDLVKNPILKWNWKPTANAKDYHFKLFKVSGDKEEQIIDDQLKGLKKEKSDLPDGRYRWSVSTLDSFGRESTPVTHEFSVTHGKSLEAPSFEMSGVQ